VTALRRVVVCAVCAAPVRAEHAIAPQFERAIAAAQTRVVKLYGAGIGAEEGYGSGVIVSADGLVATAASVFLEGPALRCVLPDGRRVAARVQARDERRQLALLQVDADGLPAFEFGDSGALRPGDWVVFAANSFNVADGPEWVSFSVGVLAGRTRLDARRRAQAFPYHGPALLTDLVVAIPGAAGGALVNLDGELVGLVGKAAQSTRTNTWINYAMPVEELAAFLATHRGESPGSPADAQDSPALPERAGGPRPALDLGIRLFDIGGRERPAYVERVRPGTAARRAGLRPNDLLLSLGGAPITTCNDFYAALARLSAGQPCEAMIKRGEEVLVVELTPEEAP